MSKFILSLSVVFSLSACASEVIVEGLEEEPEARTIPTGSPTIDERPVDGPLPSGEGGGDGRLCKPGQAFLCTLEDGSVGIRVCVDGFQLTVCSNESPVPHP